MAHEVETAMFLGQQAWHGVGKVVDNPPTIKEALVLGGLDWGVDLTPMKLDDGSDAQVPDKFAVVRDSDKKVLGVVGNSYTPLQNADALGWFDRWVESGECVIEACGSLRGGTRIWVLARIKDATGDVVKGDQVNAYLLLYTGHDGTLQVGILFTPIRVVCANTLSMATDSFKSGSILRVPHRKNILSTLDAVAETVDMVKKSFDISLDQYRAMAKKNLTVKGLQQYIRNVFQKDLVDAETGEFTQTMPRAFESIEYNFESGLGSDIKAVKGTVWAGYQAVTEWVDHQRANSDEGRLEASLFGYGRDIRNRAHEAAMTLVG